MPRKGERRAPHKPDCQCVVCIKVREKAIRVTPAVPPQQPQAVAPVKRYPAEPQEIPAGSLKIGDKFQFMGELYRAGIKEENMLKALNLGRPHLGCQVIGVEQMVKPII